MFPSLCHSLNSSAASFPAGWAQTQKRGPNQLCCAVGYLIIFIFLSWERRQQGRKSQESKIRLLFWSPGSFRQQALPWNRCIRNWSGPGLPAVGVLYTTVTCTRRQRRGVILMLHASGLMGILSTLEVFCWGGEIIWHLPNKDDIRLLTLLSENWLDIFRISVISNYFVNKDLLKCLAFLISSSQECKSLVTKNQNSQNIFRGFIRSLVALEFCTAHCWIKWEGYWLGLEIISTLQLFTVIIFIAMGEVLQVKLAVLSTIRS